MGGGGGEGLINTSNGDEIEVTFCSTPYPKIVGEIVNQVSLHTTPLTSKGGEGVKDIIQPEIPTSTKGGKIANEMLKGDNSDMPEHIQDLNVRSCERLSSDDRQHVYIL